MKPYWIIPILFFLVEGIIGLTGWRAAGFSMASFGADWGPVVVQGFGCAAAVFVGWVLLGRERRVA